MTLKFLSCGVVQSELLRMLTKNRDFSRSSELYLSSQYVIHTCHVDHLIYLNSYRRYHSIIINLSFLLAVNHIACFHFFATIPVSLYINQYIFVSCEYFFKSKVVFLGQRICILLICYYRIASIAPNPQNFCTPAI